MGMTERQQRIAQEREEIAARVATFKATQERFERARGIFCHDAGKCAPLARGSGDLSLAAMQKAREMGPRAFRLSIMADYQ
jgi:hypothetical protein